MLLCFHASLSCGQVSWPISRTLTTPLNRLSAEANLYYLRIDGRPSFVGEIEDWRKIFSLELFISRDRAEKTAVKERAELKEAGIEDVDLDVAAATGSDLLRLISATDVIELANRRLAISREDKGRHVF